MRITVACLTAGALAICGATLRAAEDEVQARVLRVCQDPGNLPFSNDKGEGFENRIAEVMAAKMGLPLESFWYPQRINVVRNTIRYKLPGDTDYRCDLLTGVPAEFGAVATTKPYFRSTYVLVYVKGRGLDVDSSEAFLALDKTKLSKLRIGIYDRTPASEWLKKHGLLDQAVPYRILNADPNFYPGRIVDHDLVEGKIDAAIVWGPIGGYFAKRVKDVDLALVPLTSEPGVRFDYAIAMGVRHGEPKWRARIQKVLDEGRDEIQTVLREYGVPLVGEGGEPR
ncbi:MAG: quinoprotein dehydrogenase-associated putative ABC transporter substrate-binding protein [Burkholderiales bacterium]